MITNRFIECFDPKRERPVRTALLFSAMICAPFAAILFCLMLASCSPATSPATSPAFLGKWADDSAAPGLVILEFRPDQSAQFSAYAGADLVLQFAGKWESRPPALIISYSQCQEGRPLRLIACGGTPDTLRTADISGDAWRIGIVDSGAVTDYHFRRVN